MSRLAIVCLVPFLAADAVAQAPAAQLESICRKHCADGGPGFAVLVAQEGAVVHRAAYGFADVAARTPLRAEQPFYVASIAKVFTAACIVHLARAGKLGLDDEVRKYVPGLPGHASGISLRHLLHHRSGLRDFYELELLAGRKPEGLTTQGVVDLLRRQHGTNFAPGVDFLYCNSGYLLLAEVVAAASGSSLREYAQRHLFSRLAMSTAVFRDAAHPEVEDLPRAYDDGVASIEPPLLCGAGGLCASVDDLHRWFTALAGGTWEPELVRELVTPPALRPDQRCSPQFNPYAGGVFVGLTDDRPVWQLLGGFGGWQAAALVFPRQHSHVVLLANCDMNALGTAWELARCLLGLAEPARPANAAKPGLLVYRAADGELLFHATRRSGPSFFTTLGWKIEVAEQEGVIRSVDARTELTAQRRGDGVLEVRIGEESARRYAPVAMAGVGPQEAESLAGTWHGAEIDADVSLVADDGKLRFDTSQASVPIAPFQAVNRDTWVSDTGMQIDVKRAADGKPDSLRISSARARGMSFTRR